MHSAPPVRPRSPAERIQQALDSYTKAKGLMLAYVLQRVELRETGSIYVPLFCSPREKIEGVPYYLLTYAFKQQLRPQLALEPTSIPQLISEGRIEALSFPAGSVVHRRASEMRDAEVLLVDVTSETQAKSDNGGFLESLRYLIDDWCEACRENPLGELPANTSVEKLVRTAAELLADQLSSPPYQPDSHVKLVVTIGKSGRQPKPQILANPLAVARAALRRFEEGTPPWIRAMRQDRPHPYDEMLSQAYPASFVAEKQFARELMSKLHDFVRLRGSCGEWEFWTRDNCSPSRMAKDKADVPCLYQCPLEMLAAALQHPACADDCYLTTLWFKNGDQAHFLGAKFPSDPYQFEADLPVQKVSFEHSGVKLALTVQNIDGTEEDQPDPYIDKLLASLAERVAREHAKTPKIFGAFLKEHSAVLKRHFPEGTDEYGVTWHDVRQWHQNGVTAAHGYAARLKSLKADAADVLQKLGDLFGARANHVNTPVGDLWWIRVAKSLHHRTICVELLEYLLEAKLVQRDLMPIDITEIERTNAPHLLFGLMRLKEHNPKMTCRISLCTMPAKHVVPGVAPTPPQPGCSLTVLIPYCSSKPPSTVVGEIMNVDKEGCVSGACRSLWYGSSVFCVGTAYPALASISGEDTAPPRQIMKPSALAIHCETALSE